ncbi:lysis system i-spanin subunit Rz [Herbaspirillum huttiense]|uniref:lysis system i-spanin subunit Rz n=1 Tax=Herbaspirillum huttiense TaxID=863372 RepID=UPI0039AFD89D
MKFTIPAWVKILASIAVCIVIVRALLAYGEHEYTNGQQAERTTWLTKENAALTRANNRIKELEEQARSAEAKHGQAMASISAQYQKDLKNERLAKDRAIDAVRRGELRLYDPGVRATGDNRVGGGQACATDATTIGRDGATRSQLSESASEFLLALAGEADEVVRQLTACQAVVKADHQMKGQE